MSRKLYKSLKAQKSQTEQVKLTIYGSLGIPLNGRKVVQVADRQGYVYVRLRDNQNEVIQAFNNRVAASYDLPVIVIREGGRYIVQQFNSQRYLNNSQNSAPFLPGHGTQHSFRRGGGADITWIYAQQIMPGLVYPNSTTGTNVRIEKYPLLTPNGQWIYAGGTGTQNILQHIPTTGSSSLMTLVYLDALTGNPGILVNSGTYFPANITGSVYPYLPSPSNTQIPLAGVLLNTGTQSITWENIYDVRQWVHATPSGTSSGGGSGVDTIGFVGQNKGAYLATGTVLNVNGTRLIMSISGTVFNLTNSPDPQDNIGIYGFSGTTGLGTGTSISFGDGLVASITGTTIYVTRAVLYFYELIPGHASNGSIAASTTMYVPPFSHTLNASRFNLVLPRAGTLKNFRWNTNSAQPASGSLVGTVQVNNADSIITATVPAGGAAQEVSDLTNTVSAPAGTAVSFELTNNATAASALIGSLSLELEIPVT